MDQLSREAAVFTPRKQAPAKEDIVLALSHCPLRRGGKRVGLEQLDGLSDRHLTSLDERQLAGVIGLAPVIQSAALCRALAQMLVSIVR